MILKHTRKPCVRELKFLDWELDLMRVWRYDIGFYYKEKVIKQIAIQIDEAHKNKLGFSLKQMREWAKKRLREEMIKHKAKTSDLVKLSSPEGMEVKYLKM